MRTIDHWAVGYFDKRGKFDGCPSGLRHCLNKDDAETVAARYRSHHNGDYRAIAFDRQGYVVETASPKTEA